MPSEENQVVHETPSHADVIAPVVESKEDIQMENENTTDEPAPAPIEDITPAPAPIENNTPAPLTPTPTATSATATPQPEPYQQEEHARRPRVTPYRSRSLRTGLGRRLGFENVAQMQDMRDPEEFREERSRQRYNGGRRLGDLIDNGKYNSRSYNSSRGNIHKPKNNRSANKRAPKPTIEDLDRELEEYMSKK